jgi:hypothetical protein
MNAGTGATAHTTVAAGLVTVITVDTGGAGYTNVPKVTFTGGGGNGATAHAVLTGQVVTAVVIDNAGTGYATAPDVHFNSDTVRTLITQADATQFPIYFDIPTAQALYFEARVVIMTGTIDRSALAAQLATALSYNIGQSADASSIVAILKTLAPNCYITAEGVSTDNATWLAVVATTGVNYQFSIPVGNITLTA